MKLTEAGIQKACIDLLEAEHIPVFRMNSGKTLLSYKGKTRCIKMNEKGTADLLALPKVHDRCPTCDMALAPAWPLWLEIKLPGKKQTAEQKDFLKKVTSRGHVYLVITDPSQLQDWLKLNGAR